MPSLLLANSLSLLLGYTHFTPTQAFLCAVSHGYPPPLKAHPTSSLFSVRSLFRQWQFMGSSHCLNGNTPCTPHNPIPRFTFPSHSFFKINFTYFMCVSILPTLCMCTSWVWLVPQVRGGDWIPWALELEAVVSHCEGPGSGAWVLWKSSRCSALNSWAITTALSFTFLTIWHLTVYCLTLCVG